MIRKDYIIRLIEQFGLLWARTLTQLRAELFSDVRATLDLAYQQILGLNSEMVRARPSGDLLARLRFGVAPEVGHERCAMLSALLTTEGELATAQSEPDLGANYYQKALDIALAMRLHQADLAPPEYAPAVERLADALKEYQLPFDTNRLLLEYYEREGAFAKAEDRLFDLAGQDSEAADTLGEGFYAQLRQRSDEQLSAGNFSRDEIASGRKQLRRLTRQGS